MNRNFFYSLAVMGMLGAFSAVFQSCVTYERLMGRGGFPEAEEHCERLRDERKYECFYRFAEAYLEKAEYEKAAQSYEKALKPYEGYRKIALAYLLKGNFEKGDEYCEKLAVKSAYDRQQCYITAANMSKNRAVAGFYEEHYDDAATYFTRAGILYHKVKLFDRSIDSYLRSAKLYMFRLSEVKLKVQQYRLKNEMHQNMEGVKASEDFLESYKNMDNPSNLQEGMEMFSRIEADVRKGDIQDEQLKEYLESVDHYKDQMNGNLMEAVNIKRNTGDERPREEIRNILAFRMLCLQIQ